MEPNIHNKIKTGKRIKMPHINSHNKTVQTKLSFKRNIALLMPHSKKVLSLIPFCVEHVLSLSVWVLSPCDWQCSSISCQKRLSVIHDDMHILDFPSIPCTPLFLTFLPPLLSHVLYPPPPILSLSAKLLPVLKCSFKYRQQPQGAKC